MHAQFVFLCFARAQNTKQRRHVSGLLIRSSPGGAEHVIAHVRWARDNTRDPEHVARHVSRLGHSAVAALQSPRVVARLDRYEPAVRIVLLIVSLPTSTIVTVG